jgi:hypothetical protein
MASKLKKATELFESLELGEQITAHKQNAETLKKSIEAKRLELSSQMTELETVQETLNA